MLSGEEIRNILEEVSFKTGYSETSYLYELGYRNPAICGDRMADLMEILEIYAKARTKEMKIALSLSIEEVLSNWTRCFTRASDVDWLRDRRAVGQMGRGDE